MNRRNWIYSAAFVAITVLVATLLPTMASASGCGGEGGTKVDTIKVSKCFYEGGGGQMLIKASSSDPTVRLFAFRPDRTLQGEVQNGGGSRYGGTVMGWIPYDPGTMTIISCSSQYLI